MHRYATVKEAGGMIRDSKRVNGWLGQRKRDSLGFANSSVGDTPTSNASLRYSEGSVWEDSRLKTPPWVAQSEEEGLSLRSANSSTGGTLASNVPTYHYATGKEAGGRIRDSKTPPWTAWSKEDGLSSLGFALSPKLLFSI
ncbi:hypothetical protein LR48_Vigan11g101200 [Vigna angularis]|uniref:Uncharacterized protein n=1 Tax=Phaseolus angularis TaxID=3914 RepID=A0A0L9VTA9_PHAAN|nr:hypothetical protein LR48_Vigan11g101200 [Vigna angularis]